MNTIDYNYLKQEVKCEVNPTYLLSVKRKLAQLKEGNDLNGRSIKPLDAEIQAWQKDPKMTRAKNILLGVACLVGAAVAGVLTYYLSMPLISCMVSPGEKCGAEVMPAMIGAALPVVGLFLTGLGIKMIAENIFTNPLVKLEKERNAFANNLNKSISGHEAYLKELEGQTLKAKRALQEKNKQYATEVPNDAIHRVLAERINKNVQQISVLENVLYAINN